MIQAVQQQLLAVHERRGHVAAASVACARWIVEPFRHNRLVLLAVGGYAVLTVVAESITGLPLTAHVRDGQWWPPISTALLLWSTIAVLSIGAWASHRLWTLERARRTDAPLAPLAEAWLPLAGWLERLLRITVLLLALNMFFRLFLGHKAAIPFLQPFSWDEPFMHLDRFLHLGQDPWRLLHPLFANAPATRALDVLYSLWFPLNLAMLLGYGWLSDGYERRRFFLAYLLMWVVLGNIAALAFSSAGPCYFDVVTGDLGPFAPLMEHLRSLHAERPLAALRIQDVILERYRTEGFQLFEGISAMPSLHVAAAVLFVFATRDRGRMVSVLIGLYALAIMIGSVHLGWHYAVDGYAAALGVAGIWWLSGRLAVSRVFDRKDIRNER